MQVGGTKRIPPKLRDAPLHWSHGFTRSVLIHNTCVRRTRAYTPKRCIRKPSRIIPSTVLLSALEISWGGCDSFGVNSTDLNLQCGYVEVPMDYHDSSAGSAHIAVIKLPATAEKLGTIFFNPGNEFHPSFVVPT